MSNDQENKKNLFSATYPCSSQSSTPTSVVGRKSKVRVHHALISGWLEFSELNVKDCIFKGTTK